MTDREKRARWLKHHPKLRVITPEEREMRERTLERALDHIIKANDRTLAFMESLVPALPIGQGRRGGLGGLLRPGQQAARNTKVPVSRSSISNPLH